MSDEFAKRLIEAMIDIAAESMPDKAEEMRRNYAEKGMPTEPEWPAFVDAFARRFVFRDQPDRVTSDEIATAAAHVLQRGNPFDDPNFERMLRGLLPSNSRDLTYRRIEGALRPLLAEASRIAGSALSQADGAE